MGKWISDKSGKPFYAKKILDINKPVKHVSAKVCGLGQFNFYVNGVKVSDHILDPGWTDYHKTVQYVTFQIEHLLKAGTNILGFEVGNGWYLWDKSEGYSFAFPEFMPPNPNPYHSFNTCLVLNVDIEIEYEDGTKETVSSDDSFLVHQHFVLSSNVYGSERIDGRKRISDWNQSLETEDWKHAQVSAWDAGTLTEQMQPPIRVIHQENGRELAAVCGHRIFDFGMNGSYMLHLEVKGKTGEEIKIYPAEKLDENGDVDQRAKNWCDVNTVVTYIIGGDDIWEDVDSRFAYIAGRYIAIEGKCEITHVKASFITSAVENSGTFWCDNEKYNQIYTTIQRTIEANMMSVHTDCPTIERFAWQEPNHLMAPSIMYMKDCRKLWRKFFWDMRDAQLKENDKFFDFNGKDYNPGEGLVPSQAPCYVPNVLPVPGMGSFYDIVPWGSASILGVYWHYMFYGDVSVIQENYEMGCRYVEHLFTKINEDVFLNYGLGDWGNPSGELARENIETAFLYADLKTMQKFADILNKAEDSSYFENRAESIRSNYNRKLLVWNEELNVWCYRAYDQKEKIVMSQGCEALPLYWGIVPENKKKDVAKALRLQLVEDQSFQCGEISLPYVIQSAAANGMNEIVSSYIMKKEHPSYYAFVLDGETTLGEYWEKNPRSHCHDMMGHIIEWYYNTLAGIIPLEPGFQKLLVRPWLPDDINEIKCTYNTNHGKVDVHILRGGKHVTLEVSYDHPESLTIDPSLLKKQESEITVNTVIHSA